MPAVFKWFAILTKNVDDDDAEVDRNFRGQEEEE